MREVREEEAGTCIVASSSVSSASLSLPVPGPGLRAFEFVGMGMGIGIEVEVEVGSTGTGTGGIDAAAADEGGKGDTAGEFPETGVAIESSSGRERFARSRDWRWRLRLGEVCSWEWVVGSVSSSFPSAFELVLVLVVARVCALRGPPPPAA